MSSVAGDRPDNPAWNSRRLWSLWDMVTLDARRFINTIVGFMDLEAYLPQLGGGDIGPISAQTVREASETIARDCKQLHLKMAADAAREMPKAKTVDDLKKTIEFVRQVMVMGLNDRKFFEPEPRYLEYFENPKLFGEQVFVSFPSATDDIIEAGTCLALERSTACVMHLMRVAESGLIALAKEVGVIKKLNDWGSYLREIGYDLGARLKSAGKHTPEEEFYAEAATQLDHIKRAWRNPTMHIEKSYSQPRAEEILLATKSLMTHLATKISE